ncbi:nuclear transport factor 2 family protein [Gordonia sp. zg691]|uniref:Nuclear transport factor 2 family protein n=1 Tax=Gordonia jinghuaiqii TaxID=2758710 RepID=A0A7D7LVS8_9ACTN|nr:nuclear transport factor 2 family protein [Gordonia jinghuaiqii]MBD0861140.1 nuclear transport factor 2 family protein [Gordonia jinghuaiqii]MCR5979700.1 nuclear transport factor 2 family protein [Gordonia jinghuaiqii]QMT00898.1 nuclear transport factor 2 family protein [Gordonia jinghuaiqii]
MTSTDGSPAYLGIDRENHPAVVAGRRSREFVESRDKQAWVDNFAADATVEDPVGPSMFDPEGVGFHGHEQISEFWDKSIAATESIEFRFDEEIICGNEVAYIGSIVTHIAGHVSEARGVFTYRADADGKLSALRAFWEVEKTIQSVRTA